MSARNIAIDKGILTLNKPLSGYEKALLEAIIE
jgi:hypothetical protein